MALNTPSVNYTENTKTYLTKAEANTPELSYFLIPESKKEEFLKCSLQEHVSNKNIYYVRYLIASDRAYITVIGSDFDTINGLTDTYAATLITDYSKINEANISWRQDNSLINNKTVYIESRSIKLKDKQNTSGIDALLKDMEERYDPRELELDSVVNLGIRDREFVESTAYFSGSDVTVFIGNIWIDEISYIQITPQQQVIPIYSIFQQTPTIFASGSFLIRGIIGINFTFANYLENLLYLNNKNSANVQKASTEGIAGGALYVSSMTIEFNNGSSPTKPVITLLDVYISGGAITSSVDGNPVQSVYQFIAGKMEKTDIIITER